MCCELNDDTALEVCSPLFHQSVVIILPVVDNSVCHAIRETYSLVQLLQLLHPDLYPKTSRCSVTLLAQSQARVLIVVKPVSRAKPVISEKTSFM